MNISGIVVKTAPEHLEQVIERLKTSGLCEVHFRDDKGKIVITLQGKDTNEEIRKLREIMELPDVLCADLAYSYSEDETALSLDKLNLNRDAVPNALKTLSSDL
ncbi:MAG TPA: chaperone NapD [Candidatus Sulfobium mesophilum]|jgi:nitrate reductase NapD|uniref:Chaperone NapD n=1 Tax=Candidatus Sulfobium mesophilum TaxID=2016548 RepID=A0A2U3QEF4_9BACT|nr:Putative periplasmic nitrate reductase NapD [Candidatus Sulfobium mesophilum]HSB31672.1 chaperone NapD [Candidatus Sulfobium mesophilum]